jgi:hypothetical protein
VGGRRRKRVAALLGLPPEAVLRLERRGLLGRLDVEERELKERLWLGHVAFLEQDARGRPVDTGSDAAP